MDAPLFYTVYGRARLMLSEYCPINSAICNCIDRSYGPCRQGTEYALLNMGQSRYPILCDEPCRTCTLHHEVRNHIDSIPEVKQHGIQHLPYTFTMEGETDCHRIITVCEVQLQMKQGV